MAERAAVTSQPSPQPQATVAPPALLVQRKCACGSRGGGGTCASCAADKKRDDRVQRRANGPAPASPGATPSVREALASPGRPLPPETRASLEPLFAADFSRVRVHADETAARSARDIAADAYTVGHDVVFARGRFAPETRAGRALLAHELTHVVQQRAGLSPRLTDGPAGEAHEREADAMGERAAALPAARAFIAEDDAPNLAPGQLRRADFLARLRPALCRAADAELARVGQDSRGCPYLERAFAQFDTQSAAQLERTMRRFAPRSARADSADQAITLVAARVAEGVRRWATTGELPDLPEGMTLDLPGGMFGGLLGGMLGRASGLLGGLSRLFFKAAPGAPAPSASAAPVSALPAGTPLAAGVRDRFSGALGHALPDVRVHTGSEAAALNARFGSRAFTLGRHVAFGPGQYQPGTPVGDALLAHELAHVVQQGRDVDAATLPGARLPSAGDASLEADADEAATGAVLSIWGRTARGLRELRRQTGPRLRSGLKLQMSNCGGGGQAAAGRTTTPVAAPRAGAACATTDAAAWRASVAQAAALTDLDAQAGAMSALVTEALCPLGLTVHTAGTSHPDTEHPDDYQPQPVVNFDVRLNRKTRWANSDRGGQPLTTNVGHNFTDNAHRRAFVVLGPLVFEGNGADTPLKTRQYAQHELYMVTHTFAAGASRDDVELETWTEDFRGYFHEYLALPYASRPTWTPLATYYGNAGATAKQRAIERLVDYYNNPPSGVDRANFQRAFASWMRRYPSTLATDLDARLHVAARRDSEAAP